MTADQHFQCHYQFQVVGLALHSLEPDEEIDVLGHLPRCRPCRAVLTDAERALAELGAATQQMALPSGLRTRILAEAAETVQDLTAGPLFGAAGEAPEAKAPEEQAQAPEGAAHARSGPTRRRQLTAVGLMIVGIVGIGGLAYHSAQLSIERDTEIAQARELAEIVTGLTQPGARHATLTARNGAGLAAVIVQNGQRMLVVSGLAPNDAERETYVLWGIGGSGPRAVGVFDVNGVGTEVRTLGPDVSTDGFIKYAVSLEQGRAAPAIPTAVVASGDLQG